MAGPGTLAEPALSRHAVPPYPSPMPLIAVDPEHLANRPWTMRRTWPDARDDFVVLVDGLSAGRIMCSARSFGEIVWFWSITGPYVPPELQPARGDCATIDEAKAAFRAKFEAWRRWAQGEGRAATWHGAG